MPDTKITALTAIGANPIIPATFPIPMVDLTDTSMAASGTTKKVTVNQILGAGGTATLASATITGDLTVDTSTLKVDSTNNRVGVNNASPTTDLDITGSTKISGTIAVGTGANAAVQKAAFLGGYTVFENSAGTGNPSITFNNDTDTGFFNAGANIIGFATGGSEQMRLNSTGLGVGVSPAYKGDFNGNIRSMRQGDRTNLAFLIDSTASPNWLQKNVIGHYYNTAYSQDALSIRSPSSSLANTASYDIISTGAHLWFLAGGSTANGSTATQAMTLDASGNLLVARTSAGLTNGTGVTIGQASIGMQTEGNATQIIVNRTTSDGTIVDLRRNNSSVGNISVTTTGATFNSTSDYRLKESVAPMSGGLARVNALKPSIYKWKSDGSNGEGFIAHELAEVVPAAVTGEKDAVNENGSIKAQGVDLSKVVPVLVAAIQELTAEVNALKNA